MKQCGVQSYIIMRTLLPNRKIVNIILFSSCSIHLVLFYQTADGGINQLPPWTDVQGDIRLTPFYDIEECVKKVEDYVAELDKGL